MNTDPKMSLDLIFGVGKVCVWRVKNEVFSKFGDLGGDFYKDTYEPKLFGMHIGSVFSGLDTGNMNNDHNMPKSDCEPGHRRGQN